MSLIVKKRRDMKGFTFLELMAVLVIVAILAAIGIPSLLRGRANAALRSAAQEVRADLELTRSYAKKGAGVAEFKYDEPRSASKGYRIVDPEGNTVKITQLNPWMEVDYTGLSDTELEFNSNGSSKVEGDIVIRSNSSNTNKFFTITLTKTTGSMKLRETN